jgi:hypothetical protein
MTRSVDKDFGDDRQARKEETSTPDAPPASPKDEGVAGIAFLVTTGQKQALFMLGYSAEQIAGMTPAQANEILNIEPGSDLKDFVRRRRADAAGSPDPPPSDLDALPPRSRGWRKAPALLTL